MLTTNLASIGCAVVLLGISSIAAAECTLVNNTKYAFRVIEHVNGKAQLPNTLKIGGTLDVSTGRVIGATPDNVKKFNGECPADGPYVFIEEINGQISCIIPKKGGNNNWSY